MDTPLSYLNDSRLEVLNELSIKPGDNLQLNGKIQRISGLIAKESGKFNAERAGVIIATSDKIPRSTSALEVEAILDPAYFNVVERVSACIDLISRLNNQQSTAIEADPNTIEFAWSTARDKYQRILSDLLVRYPVLMHPRIVIAVKHNDSTDYIPIAHAIAQSTLAALPSVSHGISDVRIREFASNSCVKRGLMHVAPNIGVNSSLISGHTALQIALSNRFTSFRSRSEGGPYLVSLLELNDLARQVTGRNLITIQNSVSDRDLFMKGCANSLLGLANAVGSVLPTHRAAFINAMLLPSPFVAREAVEDDIEKTRLTTALTPVPLSRGMFTSTAHQTIPGPIGEPDIVISEFHHAIAVHVDRGIFLDGDGNLPDFNRLNIIDRTEEVISLLVDCGALASKNAAATWLAYVTINKGRTFKYAAPSATLDSAMGFLEVLNGYEVLVRSKDANGIGRHSTLQQDDKQFHIWEQALQINETIFAMQKVISKAVSPATDVHPKSEGSLAPRRRMGSI